ncbi:MAG: endonuclease domain-containing protein [Clostridia bacterium]|nr:endonuclease domain-containing protein [Clostridia bacterium]
MPLKYNGNLVEKARDLRKNATPWENKLWYEFLNKYTPRFQRQKIIGNYIVDFYCSKAALAVELDGGGHYEEEKANRDTVRTEYINRQGIEVIRFSNFDIDTDFYEVCSAIDRRVKEKCKEV